MQKQRREKVKTRTEPIKQAKRYLQNAKATLKKSPVRYGVYQDAKYVREGAGMAYLAALRAIDGYLLEKGTPEDHLPTSIDEYRAAVSKIPHNGKLKNALTLVYQNLHIFAYYRVGLPACVPFRRIKGQRTKHVEGAALQGVRIALS